MWKAAEDGSPGTWMSPSSSSSCWVSSIRSPSRLMRAPARASRRSVWSRLGSGSITAVVPAASRPAISTHDLTWAEATGSVYSIAAQRHPVHRERGEAALVGVDPRAHLRSGMATRSTGRRRIDASPSNVHLPPGCPASQPGASRISVPALPTSMCASAAPRSPGPRTVSVPGVAPSSTSAPSARTAFSVEYVSAASR